MTWNGSFLLRCAALLALALAPWLAQAAGSSGGGFSTTQSSPVKTPEQISEGHYKSGVRQKERAWKLEQKAADAPNEKKRDRHLAKARKAFEKAAKFQTKSLKANPRNYEAANELGYALRQLGDYEQALTAYNRALSLHPGFMPAVEYRGEAYLHLGRYEDAQSAYMLLVQRDAELAGQLMASFQAWLSSRTNSGESMSDAESAFAAWVGERKELAAVDATSREAGARW